MQDVVIVSGVRTPIGGYGGTLRDIPVYRLASVALNEAIKRATIEPGWVDDVIMGQSYQNGECANGARIGVDGVDRGHGGVEQVGAGAPDGLGADRP